MAYKNRDTCLDNAAEDEPIFVLLARDAQAPETIRRWVELRRAAGQDELQCQEAEVWARMMEIWRQRNRPDKPQREVRLLPADPDGGW